MKTKLFTLLFAILAGIGTMSAEIYSGTCGTEGNGNNLQWELNTSTGVLAITGTDPCMVSYSETSRAPWYSYRSYIRSLQLSYSLIKIGAFAFEGCNQISSITIPSSVKEIGGYAFSECDALTEVTIPDGVEQINGGAFCYCDNLQKVIIGNGVTTIGQGAFARCYNLREVEFGSTVQTIGNYAFNHDPIESINLPNSLITIGNCVFWGCSSAQSLTIPENLQSIGYNAFTECGATTLKYNARNCNNYSHTISPATDLIEIMCKSNEAPHIYAWNNNGTKFCGDWPGTLMSDNGNGWYSYKFASSIKTVNIIFSYNGKGQTEDITNVTSSRMYTDFQHYVKSYTSRSPFDDMTLKSVTFGSTVQQIPEHFFEGQNLNKAEIIVDPANSAYNLQDGFFFEGTDKILFCQQNEVTTIEVPKGVRYIKNTLGGFNSCSNIEELILPETLLQADSGVFCNLSKLQSVEVSANRPPQVDTKEFEGIDFTKCVLYVPQGREDFYYQADGWKRFLDIQTKVFDATYTVRFVNYEGTELQTIQVSYGTMPEYTGEVPTDFETEQYQFTFKGWNPELVPAIKDTTYIAKYEATIKDDAESIKVNDIWYLFNDKDRTATVINRGSVNLTHEEITGNGGINRGAYSGNIVIPEEVIYNNRKFIVTSIDDKAFIDCEDVTSLYIPKTITYIGTWGFQHCALNTISVDSKNPIYDSRENCNALIETATNELVLGSSSTIIPNTTLRIVGGALGDHCNIKTLHIPASVIEIDERAFMNVSGRLETITVAEDNPKYDSRNNCNAIIETKTNTLLAGCNNTIIPNSVESIEASAFEHCRKLQNFIIPDGIKKIVNYAFWYCNFNIIVPSSVQEIEEEAFYGSYGVVYDGPLAGAPWGAQHLNVIIDGIFIYEGTNKEKLIGVTDEASGNIVIPDNVKIIGANAFDNLKGKEEASITIPNTVAEIGENAFKGVYCIYYQGNAEGAPWGAEYLNMFIDGIFIYEGTNKEKLIGVTDEASGNIVIPDNVKIIGANAFDNLKGKEEASITIPNTVAEIGENAFKGVYCIYYQGNAEGAPWGAKYMNLYKEGWVTYNDKTKTIVIKCDKEATGEMILPEGVKTITENAFEGCDNITKVALPNSLKIIEDLAFLECSELKNITIPQNVEYIGIGAFLTAEVEEEEIEVVANCKFTDIIVNSANPYYASIDGVLYDKDIKTLVQYPAGKEGVFTIPNTVDSIAIYACQFGKFSELTIPGTIKAISEYAFGGCKASSILMEEGVVEVKEGAFAGCMKLTDITLPNSLEKIGYGAFEGSLRLKSVTLGNKISYIDEYAFNIDLNTCISFLCFAEKVPECGENFINVGYLAQDEDGELYYEEADPSNLIIRVPSASIKAYQKDENWGQYTIMPLGATPVEVESVEVTPTENSVEIKWPTIEGATSYELIIKDKDDNVICTLVFDATGHLKSLVFHAQARGRREEFLNGLSFTITGLESGSKYFYNITAKDVENVVIDTYRGSFITLGEDSGHEDPSKPDQPSNPDQPSDPNEPSDPDDQALDQIIDNQSPITNKVIRDGQILILRGEKIYTVTGQEVR